MGFILLAFVGALILLVLFAFAMNRLAPLTTARLLRQRLRKKAGLVEKRIEAKGQVFPYLTGGRGEPLVLVHGFTANKDTFNALARFLTPRYTVYIPDLPGFGDSSRSLAADYSTDAQVQHVHAFVTALGLQKFHLVGSSMGGAIAAVFTAKYSDTVVSLGLINAAGTQEAMDSELFQNFRRTGVFPHLVQHPKDHWKKWNALFATPKRLPYCMDYAMGLAAARDYALHGKILRSLLEEPTIEARCGILSTPTLIITGDQDGIIPPSSVHTLGRVFPVSVIKIMANVGHIPMVEVADQTARDYLAFRTDLPSAIGLG